MPKPKGVQVSATISPELHHNLEEHRWTVRLTMTELTRRAVEEYAEKHGLLPSPTNDDGAQEDESVADG